LTPPLGVYTLAIGRILHGSSLQTFSPSQKHRIPAEEQARGVAAKIQSSKNPGPKVEYEISDRGSQKLVHDSVGALYRRHPNGRCHRAADH
jgi:hypothetical protein